MLKYRSYEPELLDKDEIPAAAFGPMLQEINYINIKLGGHRVTIEGLKAFEPTKQRQPLTIAEIGCGGGDNLKVIYNWCNKHGVAINLIGIDIREECIAYAKAHTAAIPVEYITSDYKLVAFKTKPDIIFNALFCHHFLETDLEYILGWMQQNSRLGFFINDLHRNIVAWSSISLLTKLFSKSFMVRYDAPLSVRRGFKKSEWQDLLQNAGIRNAEIRWKWAFRHLIVWRREG